MLVMTERQRKAKESSRERVLIACRRSESITSRLAFRLRTSGLQPPASGPPQFDARNRLAVYCTQSSMPANCLPGVALRMRLCTRRLLLVAAAAGLALAAAPRLAAWGDEAAKPAATTGLLSKADFDALSAPRRVRRNRWARGRRLAVLAASHVRLDRPPADACRAAAFAPVPPETRRPGRRAAAGQRGVRRRTGPTTGPTRSPIACRRRS